MWGFSFEKNKFYKDVLVWLSPSDYVQAVDHNVTLYFHEDDCVNQAQSLVNEVEPSNSSTKTVKDK